jgi:hypothetical protein
MTRKDEKKSDTKFPTALVWGVVNPERVSDKSPRYKVGEYADVVSTLYPGINFYGGFVNLDLRSIIKNLAASDLDVQFEGKLKSFKEEGDAIAALGEKVEIKSVKPCKGYEWEEWVAKKSGAGAQPV